MHGDGGSTTMARCNSAGRDQAVHARNKTGGIIERGTGGELRLFQQQPAQVVRSAGVSFGNIALEQRVLRVDLKAGRGLRHGVAGGGEQALHVRGDRKSTRLTPVTNAHLVCRLLLEKKKKENIYTNNIKQS